MNSERASGAAGDVYRSFFPPSHTLVFDGDGSGGFAGLGLDESGPIDDIRGLDLCSAGAVDPDGDGELDAPVFLALAAGSPTLATLGAGSDDVLRSKLGASGAATVWLAGASLGLVPGDTIDALASDGVAVRFSLAPGSPTLLGPDGRADPPNDSDPDDLTPGDVLIEAFVSVFPASALGLAEDDDLTGLAMGFDQDLDRVPNACDICPATANASQADADADGDACDNNPGVANPGQQDADGDGAGDVCGDGIGDVCDSDDDDGLSDLVERTLGADPLGADTDGDGFDDGVEVAAGSDPLDPSSVPEGVPVPLLPSSGAALLALALLGMGVRALSLRRA